MRIGICDDDETVRKNTKVLCKQYNRGSTRQVEYAEFSSGIELLKYEEKIDILILDIEMPHMTGIEIKNVLELKNKDIIMFFVSSHDEMVLEAFGLNVIGFVKKPINTERFLEMLEKAIERVKDPIIFKIEENVFVNSNELLYIKSERIYSILVKEDGTKSIMFYI